MAAMLKVYCRDHHDAGAELCADCRTLLEYSSVRLQRCVFGGEKPTCVQCPVHCYRLREREAVREVMRYAGPRMLWRHPLLALFHLLDGWRRCPQPLNR